MLTKRQNRRWEAAVRVRAHQNARALAVAIVAGAAWQPPAYDLGIVLEPGEVVWHRCPARYRWRGIESWTLQQVSRRGRRLVAQEIHTPCLVEAGMTDWLVTNRRLTTRIFDGQVIEIPWAAICGLTVDLAAEIVVLDARDGYHGELSGPAVAPIGVAAIATCHGRQGLLEHPGLALLRVPANRHKIQASSVS